MLAPVLLVLAGAACGARDAASPMSYGENSRAAYEDAMEAFEDENCIDAEPAFRQIRRDYPYSRYADLSELRRADCLFIEEKWAEAIEA